MWRQWRRRGAHGWARSGELSESPVWVWRPPRSTPKAAHQLRVWWRQGGEAPEGARVRVRCLVCAIHAWASRVSPHPINHSGPSPHHWQKSLRSNYLFAQPTRCGQRVACAWRYERCVAAPL
jgi:hypothetical protein